MAPKKSEKVRKLVPLKVPYEELRPFRHELRELRLEFLLWNWNCVSASICKEVLDNSATKGEELRGNEWMEDCRLQRSEEKGDRVGDHAHLTAGAHDLCDGLASRILRTHFEGTARILGKDLSRSCLGECRLLVDGTFDQSHHSLSGEFLSRNGIAYEGGGETISERAGNPDG
ncbi:hypothetical protein AXG93_1059s1000 [Marchantia polymorpha subsp. ruderalis]|uniref:Uncharacterized protein n=1 Tax=Marchantia polymorpha subsp. ruderalis TaxID=1480154 RepID=A0A176WPS7_MARPO|nr:hypothetical protein AXG93_1059s1000 [Marchantia polymorpha subsp. ruderalis]